ncbi:MAG: YqaA family protein, partial [Phycisphaerae bacterium]
IKPWELHKKLYNWVLGWADTKYGLLALIILALVEPICVPVPADVLVLGMSLGKPKNGIKYGLICSLFSVFGGTIALLLGLALGESVLSFFHSIDFYHIGDKADKALALYTKYDFWAISVSALTPVPYMLFSWLAGIANVSVVKFVLISIVFRSLRFGSEGVLFYFLGEKARDVIEKHFNTATIIVMVLLGLVVYALKALG